MRFCEHPLSSLTARPTVSPSTRRGDAPHRKTCVEWLSTVCIGVHHWQLGRHRFPPLQKGKLAVSTSECPSQKPLHWPLLTNCSWCWNHMENLQGT